MRVAPEALESLHRKGPGEPLERGAVTMPHSPAVNSSEFLDGSIGISH
jgi:hypothetical protein